MGIETSGELRFIDEYLDLERDNLRKFNALKLKNPKLKTLISIGGWNEGSKNFSIVAASSKRRERFVLSVLHFLQQYGFDGLDLAWEYPNQRHDPQNDDKTNFVKLLKELRAG